jgi:hypothetical protein
VQLPGGASVGDPPVQPRVKSDPAVPPGLPY